MHFQSERIFIGRKQKIILSVAYIRIPYLFYYKTSFSASSSSLIAISYYCDYSNGPFRAPLCWPLIICSSHIAGGFKPLLSYNMAPAVAPQLGRRYNGGASVWQPKSFSDSYFGWSMLIHINHDCYNWRRSSVAVDPPSRCTRPIRIVGPTSAVYRPDDGLDLCGAHVHALCCAHAPSMDMQNDAPFQFARV